AVDDLIRNAMIAHGKFKRAAERVHPVEDGKVAQSPLATSHLLGNPGRDAFGLLLMSGVSRQPNRRTFIVVREKVFMLTTTVPFDESGRHAHNALRAAVVLFEANDFNIGIVILELKNVAQVRTTP